MFVLKYLILCLCVFAVYSEQNVPTKSTKLDVTLYYEVLCPDSIRFFTNQMYPTYKHIGSSLNINLIPYGKAIQNKDSNGKWMFDCQHGPSECYGNTVQACILNQTLDYEVKMQILNCMLLSRNPATAGLKCAERSEVSYKPIAACTNSELGDNLLAHYGDITHSLTPNLSFVPTVVFNGKYSDKLQNKALRNMLATCCELMPESDRPIACSEPK